MLRWAIHFAPKAASELVLDFQCLLRSALIGKLCRKAHFFGLSDAREGARFFYDSTAPVLPTQHAVDRYLALVRKVGVPTPLPLEWPLPSGNLPVDFDLKTPFVVLHPFSRGKGKSLQSAEVESFCRAMAPWRVVVLGRSAEKVAALPNVDNWLNRTTLPELIAIMRQATWVVSVDSGPMHIAAALSPRVLSIHTWSDPRKVGPYPPAAWVWQKGTLFQQGAPAQARPAPLIQDTALWLKEQLAHSSDSPLASR
jgi:ADP-heptose:LPS heptosyltransferase